MKRTILSTVMALVLGVPVTHAAKPIVVEAEGLHFPEGWRVVDADYLAGTPCSENGMLHCGPGEAEDKVKLLHKIDVSGFGVWCGLRLGNLNGDDRLDIVLAQNQRQSISCLIAIDIDGGKLWQVGRPDPGNYNLDNGMRLAYRDVPDRDRRTPDADPAEPGSPITRGGPIPAQLVSSGRVLHGQRQVVSQTRSSQWHRQDRLDVQTRTLRSIRFCDMDRSENEPALLRAGQLW